MQYKDNVSELVYFYNTPHLFYNIQHYSLNQYIIIVFFVKELAIFVCFNKQYSGTRIIVYAELTLLAFFVPGFLREYLPDFFYRKS